MWFEKERIKKLFYIMERTFVIERNVESMNVLLSYNYCLFDCTTRWLRMIYLLRGNITPLHQSRSSGFNIQSTTWMTPLDAGISARYKGETFTSTNRPIANNWYKFNLNQQTTKHTWTSIDSNASLKVFTIEHWW